MVKELDLSMSYGLAGEEGNPRTPAKRRNSIEDGYAGIAIGGPLAGECRLEEKYRFTVVERSSGGEFRDKTPPVYRDHEYRFAVWTPDIRLWLHDSIAGFDDAFLEIMRVYRAGAESARNRGGGA